MDMIKELSLIEVKAWEDMQTQDLHIKEVWSDGNNIEYIYSYAKLLDNPRLYGSIMKQYQEIVKAQGRPTTHSHGKSIRLIDGVSAW